MLLPSHLWHSARGAVSFAVPAPRMWGSGGARGAVAWTDISKYNKSAKDSTSGFLMRKIANVVGPRAAKIMRNGRN